MECKKAKFATEAAALAFIKKLKATSKREHIPSNAYLCQRCFAWHLTKQEHFQKVEFETTIKNLTQRLAARDIVIAQQQKKIDDLLEKLQQANKREEFLQKLLLKDAKK